MSREGQGDRERVIVVEDDPKWLEVVSEALHKEGFEAIQVASGLAALHALQGFARDAVGMLVDVMLPGISGWELAARIRSDQSIPTIPIVFMSAHHADEIDFVRPIAEGAFDVISKEQGPTAIASALRVAIAATKAVEGRA